MTNPVYSLTRVPSSRGDLTWQLRQEAGSPSLDNEAIVRSCELIACEAVAASTTAKWLAGQYAV